VEAIMEYESQSFSWPTALASWLARFCSGSDKGDGHADLVVDDGTRGQMAAAAKHHCSAHKIKFS
jgi:hypothetical protein